MNVKLLNSVAEAADQLSLSERTIYRLIKAGRLEAGREGRAVRVLGRSLLAYVDSLPPYTADDDAELLSA